MKLFIHLAAEQDILRQVEWYAEQGLPDIARRFHTSTLATFDTLLSVPNAGTRKAAIHEKLAGLRVWPLRGFDEFRVFYLLAHETLTVLRVLHGKRDIGAILDEMDDLSLAEDRLTTDR